MKTFLKVFLFSLFVLGIFHIPSFYRVYIINSGIEAYQKGDYNKAQEVFSSLSGETLVPYNLGSTFFQQGLYQKALDSYNSENPNSVFTLHNKGSTLYQLGFETSDLEQKKKLWQESLASYTGSYQGTKLLQTKINYDFVEKKLRELIPPPGGVKDDPKETPTASGSSDPKEKKDQQGQQASQEGSSGAGQQGADSYKLGEKDRVGDISPGEREEIEQYKNQLQQAQENNQQYFNQKDQFKSPFDDMIDPFTGEALFESVGEQEKNW